MGEARSLLQPKPKAVNELVSSISEPFADRVDLSVITARVPTVVLKIIVNVMMPGCVTKKSHRGARCAAAALVRKNVRAKQRHSFCDVVLS